MRAVVLAGGEGTRLRPLTYAVPKPLLPIANRAFLEHQLGWLGSYGVTEVVLALGYRSDAFRRSFPDGRAAGLPLRIAVEPEPMGTGGAIRFAAEGTEERFVVCNGDVLTDLDLGLLLRFHAEREAEATIALTQVDDPTAFGVVPTDADGRVLGFIEKPARGEAPTDWVNAGTYVFEPGILERIPPGQRVSVERDTFPALLAEGGGLFAMPEGGYWLDIGTPAKYLQAHLDALIGRGHLLRGATEVAPGVWLQGDASVDASARLEPPVLLGVGAVVEPDAMVAASVLGPGASVGKGAVVARSVLLDGAWVDAGAETADSVIGFGAVVGPEAVVTDLTVVGPGAAVAAGARHSGARVEQAPGDAPPA
jgi:mannose-1-phosphate guanylyltransferase